MSRNPQKGVFVTGTDTEVGKTFVTCLLAKHFVQQGVDIGVYKPVASGCVRRDGELISEDAESLWRAAGQPNTLHDVTPQLYEEALAPNVAARLSGAPLDEDQLFSGVTPWRSSEFLFIEGVGGLFSPISDGHLVADVAHAFGFPLLLIVANRLGCINQTLLTLAGAESRNLNIIGIVLNDCGPSDSSRETNFEEIQRLSTVPVLAHIHRDSRATLFTVGGLKRRLKNRLKRVYHSSLGLEARRLGKRLLGRQRSETVRRRIKGPKAEAAAPRGYRLGLPRELARPGRPRGSRPRHGLRGEVADATTHCCAVAPLLRRSQGCPAPRRSRESREHSRPPSQRA